VAALVDRESRRFGELGLRSAILSDERWLEKLSLEPLLLRMPLVRHQQQLTIGQAPETWTSGTPPPKPDSRAVRLVRYRKRKGLARDR